MALSSGAVAALSRFDRIECIQYALSEFPVEIRTQFGSMSISASSIFRGLLSFTMNLNVDKDTGLIAASSSDASTVLAPPRYSRSHR